MRRFMLVLAGALIAAQSYAVESMSFQIEQGLLLYSSVTTSTTVPDIPTSKETETSMSTMPNSLVLCGILGPVRVYLYPTRAETPFALGYMIKKNLEVGFQVAMNSDKLKNAGAEKSRNSLGGYGIWTLPVGHDSVEVSVPLTYTFGSDKSSAAGIENSVSRIRLEFGANYIHSFAKNVAWMGGLFYRIESETTKPSSTGKETINSNGYEFNLSSLRFTF